MINKLYDGCVQLRRRWTGDVGEYSLVDEVATDKLMQEAAKHIEKLEEALQRIRDLNFEYTGNWQEGMQQIAREALE